jgi:hypothetical protein
MREAVVNRSLTPLDIENAVINGFKGMGLTFSPTSDQITVCPRSQYPAAAGTINTGNPKGTMIFRIDRDISFFFTRAGARFGQGLDSRTITVSGIALGTNEPE